MNASKTDAHTLRDLPHVNLGRNRLPTQLFQCLYSYQRDDLQFDYLFKPVDKPLFSTRLVVLFSGAVDRTRLQPPVFQRWSWADTFEAHVLYLADPGLRLADELTLAWYFGTVATDATLEYAALISELAARLGVPYKDVVLYGSSGGGFAALQTLRHIPKCAAVAINPQVRLRDYYRRIYEKFVSCCIGLEPIEPLKPRIDLFESVAELRLSRIVVAQNTLDAFHLEKHFAPFVAAMRATEASGGCLLQEFFFENEAGHGGGEPAALVPKLMTLVRGFP